VSGIVDGPPLLRVAAVPTDSAVATLGARDDDHVTRVAAGVDLADHRCDDPQRRRARRTRLALLKEAQEEEE
jgi:hypothetical protein